MKTAVAVHGCHVGAVDWEDIVWGDPKNGVYGRAAAAVLLAWQINAEMISFSTGASEREGKKEAQLIYELALSLIDEVFENPNDRPTAEWLKEIAVVDVESQNTADEMRYLEQNCLERKIEELFLVSSPWHIMRCHKEALIYQANNGFDGVQIYAHASDDSSLGLGAGSVVILEPPHRGDDPSLKFSKDELMHLVVPRLFELKPEERAAVVAGLDAMINTHLRANDVPCG